MSERYAFRINEDYNPEIWDFKDGEWVPSYHAIDVLNQQADEIARLRAALEMIANPADEIRSRRSDIANLGRVAWVSAHSNELLLRDIARKALEPTK